MNAPDSPPTDEEAITPPFLTASVSSASAAVVPGAPMRSSPIASRISATDSPRDRVHVDAGARGGDVDRRADALRDRERLGDGVEQPQIAGRGALLDVRRETGDVIDAELGAGAIERLGERHVSRGARRLTDERD